MTPEISLTDPDLLHDPAAGYGRARELAPVVRLVAPGLDPIWAVTRYAQARRMLTDPRFALGAGSYRRPAVPEECLPYLRTMQEMEGEEHARLRRALAPVFNARSAARFGPRVEAIVERLLDALPPGPVDLLAGFAQPLPMEVICELVGVDERERWHEYGAAIATGHGTAFQRAIPAIITDARAALVRRRAEPRDDLLSGLLGTELTEHELITLVWHLVLAGQTPTHLVANAVAALLEHPEQLARLRADPGLLPEAVEELTRWSTPQLLTVLRSTREEIEVGGVTVPAGAQVTALLLAANRDPRVFSEPERLDLGRKGSAHLAYGYGPHFCLGAALARVQTEATLAVLLRRCPRLALAAEVTRLPDPATRRLAALPVTLA